MTVRRAESGALTVLGPPRLLVTIARASGPGRAGVAPSYFAKLNLNLKRETRLPIALITDSDSGLRWCRPRRAQPGPGAFRRRTQKPKFKLAAPPGRRAVTARQWL